MQRWKCVVWHHREHVVFYMIIHIPIEKAKDGIHVDGAGVMAMVQNVFCQTSVLGQAKDDV